MDERHVRGARSELAVARYLEERGYSIEALNLRLGRLEIDVVARIDDVIAVVEVRTRGEGAWTSGFGSIDAQKRMRIRRAGERLWQRRYQRDASVNRLRFDAASVTWTGTESQIEYAVAAF